MSDLFSVNFCHLPRIWDVNERFKSKQVIVVKSKERGTRTKITSCAYSHDGRLIGGTGLDGTLHLWPTNGNYARPSQSIEGAHVKGKVTSSLIFSLDTHSLVTRGGDDTVKCRHAYTFNHSIVYF